MKIYIASSLECQERCKTLRRDLVREGIEIVSTWIEKHCWSEDPKVLAREARADYNEVLNCDVFIHAFPEVRSTGGGADTELGIALMRSCKIIVYGDKTNVFHWLPKVRYAEDFSSLLEELRK